MLPERARTQDPAPFMKPLAARRAQSPKPRPTELAAHLSDKANDDSPV
jgi:hypothetical protein